MISADAADNSPHTDTLLFGINSAVDSDLIIYNSAEFQVGLGFSPTDDAYNFDEDTSGHTLNVLANDGDSADSLTISSVSTPSNGGTVTIATDGKSVEYTPAADFFGEDVFTYTAGDQSGSSQATVTVQVFPVQDPPIANEDIISSVNEDDVNILLDLMSNDSIAPDTGETLRIVAVTQEPKQVPFQYLGMVFMFYIRPTRILLELIPSPTPSKIVMVDKRLAM